jgi:hypothetical protein
MDVLTVCTDILETYARKVGIRPILPARVVTPVEEAVAVVDVPFVNKKKTTLYTKVEEPKSSVKFERRKVPEVPESVRNLVLSRTRTRFTNEGTTTIRTSTLVE